MPQHPGAHIRRARFEFSQWSASLHKRGYQRLRAMPYFGPTWAWRCSIAPVILFHRNHGATPACSRVLPRWHRRWPRPHRRSKWGIA